MSSKLTFFGWRAVRNWLVKSARGAAILDELTDEEANRRAARQIHHYYEPVKVLVVAHGDGRIEVFTDRRCDVRICQTPRLVNRTPATEIMVERTVEASIPQCWQQTYEPGRLRDVAQWRPRAAADW